MTTLIQAPEVLIATGKCVNKVGTLAGSTMFALALAEIEVACTDAFNTIPANRSVFGVSTVCLRRLDLKAGHQL